MKKLTLYEIQEYLTRCQPHWISGNREITPGEVLEHVSVLEAQVVKLAMAVAEKL